MSYLVYKEYLDRYYENLDMAKCFVVAYLSLHDGKLKQEVVYTKTPLQAAVAYLGIDAEEFKSMEDVYDYCASADSYISVLEVNNTLTE